MGMIDVLTVNCMSLRALDMTGTLMLRAGICLEFLL